MEKKIKIFTNKIRAFFPLKKNIHYRVINVYSVHLSSVYTKLASVYMSQYRKLM